MSAEQLHLRDARLQFIIAAGAVLLLSLLWFLYPARELPLLAVLLCAALVLSIHYPALSAAAFLCVSLFRLHEAYPVFYELGLPLLFSALSIAALAWHVLITRSRQLFWTPELRALIVFSAIVTAGAFYAESPSAAWTYWNLIFSKVALMTLVLAWLPRTQWDFQLIARAIILSGIFVSVVMIGNWYSQTHLVELTRVTIARDLQGVLADPNDLALVLLIPLSFSLAGLGQAQTLDRLLAGMGAFVVVVAIFLTQSRGGLLGMAGVLAFFGLRFKSRLLFCLLAVGVGVAAIWANAERISVLLQTNLDESSLERLRAWGGALRMAMDHPLGGVGLNNFSTSLPDYSVGRPMAPHSTWLGVLAETGFLGFTVFMLMVGFTVRSAYRSHKYLYEADRSDAMHAVSSAILAALAGFGIAASFLTHGFTWPLYMLVGLTAALSHFVLGRKTASLRLMTGASTDVSGV